MLLEDLVQYPTQFIFEITNSGWFLTFKFILLALNLFSIIFIVWVLIKMTWFGRLILWDIKEYLTFRHYGLPRIEKEWVKIRERLEIGTESEAKLAIFEAEALLDDILKKEGFLGKTLDERLEKLSFDIISNLTDVREAHKVRFNIIHDPSYRLDIKEAKKLLDIYEKALDDLQAL